jgi:hypothetical protein
MTRSSMVAWKMPTFFNVWRRTVVHSYSKKIGFFFKDFIESRMGFFFGENVF